MAAWESCRISVFMSSRVLHQVEKECGRRVRWWDWGRKQALGTCPTPQFCASDNFDWIQTRSRTQVIKSYFWLAENRCETHSIHTCDSLSISHVSWIIREGWTKWFRPFWSRRTLQLQSKVSEILQPVFHVACRLLSYFASVSEGFTIATMTLGTLDHVAENITQRVLTSKTCVWNYCLHSFGAFSELDMLAHIQTPNRVQPCCLEKTALLGFLIACEYWGLLSMYNYSLFITRGP